MLINNFISSNTVGLYIEGKRIYVAELSCQFGESKISHAGQSEVVLTQVNPTPDDEAVSRAILEMLNRESIRHKDVIVALTEKESMIRYFEMPILRLAERRNSVRFEAQKYLPFDIRELYFDYSLQIDKAQNRMKVTFFAAKKEAVNRLSSIVRGAGLRVRAIESASMALTRAFYPVETKALNEAFAVLDIDKNGFINIFIVKNGLIVMTRDHIYFKPAAIGDVTENDFKACVSEVRLSLNYFSKTFKNENLARIVLGADLKGAYKQWDSMLEVELGIPVRVGNPMGYFPANQSYSGGLTTAIGLAMRGIPRARGMRLNLNPKGDVRPANIATARTVVDENDFLKKAVICEVIFVAIFGMIVYYGVYSKLLAVRGNFTRQSQSTQGLSALSAEEVNAKATNLSGQINFLSNLVQHRVYFTQKMNSLAKTLPPEVSLSALFYDEREGSSGKGRCTLSLEGIIVSHAGGVELTELNQLVATLSQDKEFMKGFDDVRIVSAQNQPENDRLLTRFVINCTTQAPEKTQ